MASARARGDDEEMAVARAVIVANYRTEAVRATLDRNPNAFRPRALTMGGFSAVSNPVGVGFNGNVTVTLNANEGANETGKL